MVDLNSFEEVIEFLLRADPLRQRKSDIRQDMELENDKITPTAERALEMYYRNV